MPSRCLDREQNDRIQIRGINVTLKLPGHKALTKLTVRFLGSNLEARVHLTGPQMSSGARRSALPHPTSDSPQGSKHNQSGEKDWDSEF